MGEGLAQSTHPIMAPYRIYETNMIVDCCMFNTKNSLSVLSKSKWYMQLYKTLPWADRPRKSILLNTRNPLEYHALGGQSFRIPSTGKGNTIEKVKPSQGEPPLRRAMKSLHIRAYRYLLKQCKEIEKNDRKNKNYFNPPSIITRMTGLTLLSLKNTRTEAEIVYRPLVIHV